jgi:hypothetical protein
MIKPTSFLTIPNCYSFRSVKIIAERISLPYSPSNRFHLQIGIQPTYAITASCYINVAPGAACTIAPKTESLLQTTENQFLTTSYGFGTTWCNAPSCTKNAELQGDPYPTHQATAAICRLGNSTFLRQQSFRNKGEASSAQGMKPSGSCTSPDTGASKP